MITQMITTLLTLVLKTDTDKLIRDSVGEGMRMWGADGMWGVEREDVRLLRAKKSYSRNKMEKL